jgi:hypothetical protein
LHSVAAAQAVLTHERHRDTDVVRPGQVGGLDEGGILPYIKDSAKLYTGING